MPKIGKNVLENLTQGMYDDSRIIYREYIQNSADQIDEAIQNNSFPNEQLEIQVKIEVNNRNIIIHDNANGIPKAEVEKRLADVADSQKVQGQDKGFRGIGRLGGLGYCRELRFITTYAGENVQTTMIWDAAKLEAIFGDSNIHDSAEEILDQIITYRYDECDKREHFFRVELIDVKSTNDKLLEIEDIKDYISEVAPLEYHESFCFLTKVEEFLFENKNELPNLNKYRIFVNDEEIYRNYSTYLYKVTNKYKELIDEMSDIQLDIIRSVKSGEAVAWIWYAITSFKGRLQYTPMHGLRLRQFNIEIGDSKTLGRFFKEDYRANDYYIGEVHAILSDLIPNARRDYFNENLARQEFEEALRNYISNNLDTLYKVGSDINSSYKKWENYKSIQEEYAQKQKHGFTSKNDEHKVKQKLELAETKAREAEKNITKLKNKAVSAKDSALQKVINKVVKEREKMTIIIKPIEVSNNNPGKKNKPKRLVDELHNLNRREREVVDKVYGVIQDNLSTDISEVLIQKIQDELKKQK